MAFLPNAAIEITDIIGISIMYIIFGYIFGIMIDTLFINFFGDVHNKKSAKRLFFEIIIQVTITCVIAYFIRNFVQNIPFIFDNINGYKHANLTELKGALLNTIILYFQKQLQEKMSLLRNKNIKDIIYNK